MNRKMLAMAMLLGSTSFMLGQEGATKPQVSTTENAGGDQKIQTNQQGLPPLPSLGLPSEPKGTDCCDQPGLFGPAGKEPSGSRFWGTAEGLLWFTKSSPTPSVITGPVPVSALSISTAPIPTSPGFIGLQTISSETAPLTRVLHIPWLNFNYGRRKTG